MSILKDGELYLYGVVGDNYWDEGFTASEVVDALIDVGRENDVIVHINSGGGYTDDGIAIYNSLKAHKGKVTVVVDAMAASSASLIAMAGDERIMLAGSLMMIHDPSGYTWGNASEHTKKIAHLNKLGDLMASIYSDASNDNSADLRKEMDETIWLNPSEALERGFATSVGNETSKTVAAFDYRVYAHAPDRLVALSNENSWSLKKTKAKKTGAKALVANGHKGECKMSKTPSADPKFVNKNISAGAGADDKTSSDDLVAKAVAADRQRRSDIMALDDAKGREDLAETLFATDLSIDQVKAALSAAPKAENANQTQASEYEANRAEASSLAMPSAESTGTTAKIDSKAIYAMRQKQIGE